MRECETPRRRYQNDGDGGTRWRLNWALREDKEVKRSKGPIAAALRIVSSILYTSTKGNELGRITYPKNKKLGRFSSDLYNRNHTLLLGNPPRIARVNLGLIDPLVGILQSPTDTTENMWMIFSWISVMKWSLCQLEHHSRKNRGPRQKLKS